MHQYAALTRERLEAENAKLRAAHAIELEALRQTLRDHDFRSEAKMQKMAEIHKQQELQMLRKVNQRYEAETAQLKAQQCLEKESHDRAVQEHEQRLADHIASIKSQGQSQTPMMLTTDERIRALEAAHAEQLVITF